MTRRNDSACTATGKPSSRGARERGNIVLISALIVLSMGVTAVVVSKLIQSRLTLDADLRLSNYGGTLAQYTAESGFNSLLWYWNTRKVTPPARPAAPDTYPDFDPVVATYSVPGGGTFLATTICTYSIDITEVPPIVAAGTGTYSVVVQATASSAGASAAWQTITRRITVTVASTSTAGSPYKIVGYSR